MLLWEGIEVGLLHMDGCSLQNDDRLQKTRRR